MATITVDQQKLVLNAFAAIFQNNLVSKDAVTWNQYSGEMDDRNGLKVSEQVGPRYVVTQTTSGVKDLSGGVQDSVFGSEQFVVNKTFGASMGWADFVRIRDVGDARESVALKNAATQLAEVIDNYILQTSVLAANNEVGTAGNNVATYADVLTGYTRLKKEGVDDSELRMILSYDDLQALGTTVVAYTAPDSLVTETFRAGFTGKIAGLPVMYTQQLSGVTPGTRTNGSCASGQNVHYSAVAVSGAPGQYMTQTINLTGLGAGGTIKDGEIFTIAGCFAYDNRKHAALPHLQQFRVIGDTTADGTGNASPRIFPALILDDGSSTSGDAGVDRAHATVASAPTGAVTFRGTASTAYTPRAIIQKQAIVVNTADLILPATGIGSRKALTQVPLSVRMWQDSTFATGNHQVRFDVALTANVRDRRRIVRLNGA
ncbi:MAG TPA: P22 phage major capsid protein family protein [Candidatus Paceibacterota bacterium]